MMIYYQKAHLYNNFHIGASKENSHFYLSTCSCFREQRYMSKLVEHLKQIQLAAYEYENKKTKPKAALGHDSSVDVC